MAPIWWGTDKELSVATRKLPIVLAGGNLTNVRRVESQARPGGNMTGVSIDWSALQNKRLEFVRESVPTASSVAYLGGQHRWVAEAAHRLDLQLINMPLIDPIGLQAYTQAFTALEGKVVDLLCPSDVAENFRFRALIVRLAAQHRLPAGYAYREFVEIGGPMSYGTDMAEWGRL